jgi:hypothetical protein
VPEQPTKVGTLNIRSEAALCANLSHFDLEWLRSSSKLIRAEKWDEKIFSPGSDGVRRSVAVDA